MKKTYICNLTKIKFDFVFLKDIVKKIGQIKSIKQGEIGLILLDDEEIQRYNLKYRGVDRPTDVLAFPVDENTGEILISLDSAKKQAKIYRQSLKDEMSLLVLHGFLHLAGYKDNSKKNRLKMEKEEENILNLIKTQ